MKNVKNNNKGFSLVELIVVVLIMAILAVALAPQVMKWVDNSRMAADLQTKDSLVSAYTLAMTDTTAYSKKPTDASATVTYSNDNAITAGTDGTVAIATEIKNVANTYFGAASVSIKSSGKIEISIASSGAVTGKLFASDGTTEINDTNIK